MSNYITFIDSVGRNILGTLSSAQQSGSISVDNPVMIAVQPANGQLQVQLIPLFLAEFVKYSDTTKRNFTFTYPTNAIAIGSGFEIDQKILEQYKRIVSQTFDASLPTDSHVPDAPKVVKLFDDAE